MFIYIIMLNYTFISCVKQNKENPVEKHYRNKNLILRFNTISYNNEDISFSSFRKDHPYLFVNYLDEECGFCSAKATEWYNKRNLLLKDSLLAYVFIFRGNNLDSFLNQSIGNAKFPFYIIKDPNYSFLKNNNKIPREVIDKIILIDKKNKMKQFCEPFLSEDLFNIYKELIE